MKYYVMVGGKEYAVDVDTTGDAMRLTLDGANYRVDVSAVQHGEQYSVLVDERSFAVSVDGDGRKLALVLDGYSYAVGVEDDRERASRALSNLHGSGGGVIESVMPGIVRKVEVQVGDTVKRGDRLLVLEAMKMENEILADADGVVAKVHVAAGQTVEGGAPLVSLDVK